MVEAVANKMLLKADYIDSISQTASHRYKKFYIEKRDGGKRLIFEPSKELKAIQRIILDDFFINLPVHHNAHAYIKGNKLNKAVIPHINNRYFMRIDLKDFFYSISKKDLKMYLNDTIKKYNLSWKDKDVKFLLNISCFHDNLVIGAVTSPYLSNAICYDMDQLITNACLERGIVYSRYSDDLFFSTSEQNILFNFITIIENIIKQLNYPSKLKINYKKIRHTSHKRQVRILGLNITNDGNISIGRNKKKKIKKSVYNWIKLSPKEKLELQGNLAFIKSVEPSFLNSLCLKYGSLAINQIIHYK